jgi:hypothetical protein
MFNVIEKRLLFVVLLNKKITGLRNFYFLKKPFGLPILSLFCRSFFLGGTHVKINFTNVLKRPCLKIKIMLNLHDNFINIYNNIIYCKKVLFSWSPPMEFTPM